MQQNFIHWLSQELKARNWSQGELARRSGISRPLITRMLSGDMPVSADTCIKIANALGLPPVSLLKKSGILPLDTIDNIVSEELRPLIEIASQLPFAEREKLVTFAKFLAEGK